MLAEVSLVDLNAVVFQELPRLGCMHWLHTLINKALNQHVSCAIAQVRFWSWMRVAQQALTSDTGSKFEAGEAGHLAFGSALRRRFQ